MKHLDAYSQHSGGIVYIWIAPEKKIYSSGVAEKFENILVHKGPTGIIPKNIGNHFVAFEFTLVNRHGQTL